MGFKSTHQSSHFDEAEVEWFFKIDDKLSYFFKGVLSFELRDIHLTDTIQSKIEVINQKLDSITGVYPISVDDDEEYEIFPNLDKLDYILKMIDEENQCEVSTSKCVPV